MRKQMEELSAAGDKDEEASTLKSSLDEKEKELYKLAAELDDAVRFKKQPERAERAEHEPKAAPKEGSNEGAAPAAAPAKARW